MKNELERKRVRRESNPRHPEPESGALSPELRTQLILKYHSLIISAIIVAPIK